MPTYGTTTRAKPRLNVLRGFKGNEPQSLNHSAKPKAGEEILSGMIISLDSNNEWVKGAPAGKVPYIAYHDQADLDVTSIGLLLGLSCAGDYVVQTAYFASEGTFGNNVFLLADAEDDAVSGVRAGLPGYIAKAVARTTPAVGSVFDLIGVTSHGGKVDRANVDSNSTKDAAGKVLVLTWTTRWQPFQTVYGLAAS